MTGPDPAGRRLFTPHVTLPRLGPRVPVAMPGIPIDRFELYASRLDPGGAVHVPEAVFPLSEPA
ncbi:MAG: hypothetical protein ACK6CT_14045 [Planctomycetia bacterium]|jgi:2'-5' RNA ligase